MHLSPAGPVVLAAFALVLGFASPCAAEVVITIHKSAQRMSVAVDGVERYHWAVSTGVAGGPMAGTFRPQRLERSWYSRAFGMSPMPYSIFFHKGFAIHGTPYVSRLGRRASHGCVRLHPSHAATLFGLVQREGVSHTRIVIVR